MKIKLATVTLFVAALLAAMTLGGSVYEALVVYPAWSASPPASLALLQGPHAVDSTRFWILVHVCFEIALIAALALTGERRGAGGPSWSGSGSTSSCGRGPSCTSSRRSRSSWPSLRKARSRRNWPPA